MNHPLPHTREFLSDSRVSTGLLLAAVVMVCLTIVMTQHRVAMTQESALLVDRTNHLIDVTHDFLINVGAADAMHRDIILVKNDGRARRLFAQVNKDIDTLLLTIRQLRDPDETRLLNDKVIPLTRLQQQRWMKEIATYEDNPAGYVTLMGDSSHNDALNKIRVATTDFIDSERLLLKERTAELNNDFVITNVLRFSFLAATGIICVLAYYTIRRNQRENKNLVERLEESNTMLEYRIDQRTAELSQRNEDMKRSLDVIQELHEDIAQHSRQQEELLNELQLLYDQAPCGYHTVDASGKIIKINKTELDWLGYTEEEVIGVMKVDDVLTKESAIERHKQLEVLKKIGHLENLEFDCVRKDRSVFPILLNTKAYYDENGNFILNRSSMHDISQRKTLEEQLKEANDYLIKLNEEKNRYLGMATHDLKNPINGIASLVQLMKTTTLSEPQLEYLNFIELSVQKMKDLIEKLLDLNKIERSTVMEVTTFYLDAFLQRSFNTFERVAKNKGIELILDNRAGHLKIHTDAGLLEQVIDNLVSNAIKFSQGDKKVWIRSRMDEKELLIDVEDQGPGIKKEEMPRLFGSFQKLSARPTAGESSSGLGLSIVKKIVQSLGGDIKVNSVVGEGSTFRVVLDRKRIEG